MVVFNIYPTFLDKKQLPISIPDSNGNDYATGVALTDDGSALYVVGYGSFLVPGGNADWRIKKISSDGVEQ
jgi:hypothetical protein